MLEDDLPFERRGDLPEPIANRDEQRTRVACAVEEHIDVAAAGDIDPANPVDLLQNGCDRLGHLARLHPTCTLGDLEWKREGDVSQLVLRGRGRRRVLGPHVEPAFRLVRSHLCQSLHQFQRHIASVPAPTWVRRVPFSVLAGRRAARYASHMSMGIAYRARLPKPDALPALLEFMRTQCELRGWLYAEPPAQQLAPARVRSIEGRTQDHARLDLAGIWVNPHFGCDDLCLVFDRLSGSLIDPSRSDSGDGALPLVNDFALTRTTYADAAIQVELVATLEELASRDLASVELGDPAGKELSRDRQSAEQRILEARVSALEACRARPAQPIRLGGIVQFLSPDELAEVRAAAPGPVERLEARERDALLSARSGLLDAWLESTPGLAMGGDTAATALEQLTDQLLSTPSNRHDGRYLEDTFVWQLGSTIGFLLIETLGGHWERGGTEEGLRVANLGGVGLTWSPMRAAVERLQSGPMYAPDRVLGWLRGMVAAGRKVFPPQ